jgi:integral membrane sensor domain MASE1
MTGEAAPAGALLRRATPALRILLTALAYYGAARIGLEQELVHGQVTPLWPPTGIALAALIFWGPHIWPGIALGAFAVNLAPGPGTVATLVIAAGNTVAPLVSYWVLRRLGFRDDLARLRDALALVFPAALGGMLISATVGTGTLVLSPALDAADFWPTWWVWWTGDAMGVLVVAPFLLALRMLRVLRVRPPWPAGRAVEAFALLGGVAAVTIFATRSTLHLAFLVAPFLIWAAFRFQLAGAAPCALIVSVISIVAATDRVGAFSDHELLARMFTLQAFNGTTALTALILSALITERNATLHEIERLVDELADTVAALTPRER